MSLSDLLRDSNRSADPASTAEAEARTRACVSELADREVADRTKRAAGRSRVLRVAGAGAVVLGVVAVVLLSSLLDGSRHRPEPASAASRFLHRIADLANDRPEIRLKRGQFFASRSIERTAPNWVPYEQRTWRAADGTGRRVWLKNGKVVFDRRNDPAIKQENDLGLSRQQVMGLPTQPDKLADRLWKIASRPMPVVDPETLKPTGRHIYLPKKNRPREVVFNAVHLLAYNLPLPNRLRAALFQIAANTPGVRYIGKVKDPLGRPGIAVAFDGDAAHEYYGREFIIDPRTTQLLATIDYRHGDLRKVAGISTVTQGVVDGIDDLIPAPSLQKTGVTSR